MIEGRADRRERELQAAVDDVKSTSKIESARLQAIHSQELREKDEQLVRFQADLEQLVRSLRQWQLAALDSSKNPTSNNENESENRIENRGLHASETYGNQGSFGGKLPSEYKEYMY